MDDRRLVYSTDGDLPLPRPERKKQQAQTGGRLPPNDGVIRVMRERRRAGVMTVVHGLAAAELDETGKTLRRRCGTGGTVRAESGVVELQGDHRDRVVAFFESLKRRVKKAGA